MPELSGWLWLVIDVALVVLLGLAIVYGIARWRNRPRDPATERVRDEATRRTYRE